MAPVSFVWTALRWQTFFGASAQRWLGVSGVFMRPFRVPLAIMPFARLRSRSKARTRSAPAFVGLPEPGVIAERGDLEFVCS
jgi:hypothetical protein